MARLSSLCIAGIFILTLSPIREARSGPECADPASLPPPSDGVWSDVSYLPDQTLLYFGAYDPMRDRLYAYRPGLSGSDRIFVMPLDAPGRWTPLATGPGPGSIWLVTHLFMDVAADRLLFYAGEREIWELPLQGPGNWVRLDVQSSPTARNLSRAIYDPVNDRLIRFGGGDTNEIFMIDLSGDRTWRQVVPDGPAPAGRSYPGAVYDPVRRQMIVFGGRRGSSSNLDDLWALSLDGPPVWTELAAQGIAPSARYLPSIVHDPVADRFVLFSGMGVTGRLTDVWTLDLKNVVTWIPRSPTGQGPDGRLFAMAAYDPHRNRMLFFGGHTGTSNRIAEKSVWALSLAGTMEWSFVAGAPYRRYGESVVLDSRRHRAILYGGNDGDDYGHDADLWTMTLDDGVWTRREPVGTRPQVRDYQSAIIDPDRDRMIVFGGSLRNDLWSLSLETMRWTELTPAGGPPPPRLKHAAVYDPVRDRMVIIGGDYDGTIGCHTSYYYRPMYTADVWTLPLAEGGTWSEDFSLSGGPYDNIVPVFDPLDPSIVLIGGSVTRAYCIQDVEYLVDYRTEYFNNVRRMRLGDPASWSVMPTPGENLTRIGSGAVFDPYRDRILTWGGSDRSGAAASGVIEMTVPDGEVSWRRLAPEGTGPSGTTGRSTLYDPVTGSLWVFNPDGNMSVWRLDLEGDLPERAAVLEAEGGRRSAHLVWCVDDAVSRAVRLFRRAPGGDWSFRAALEADESGRVLFDDDGLGEGTSYDYRLELDLKSYRIPAGEATITTTLPPAFQLSRVEPNPAVTGFRLTFDVPRAGAVRVDVFDVSGRPVLRRDLDRLEPGLRTVDFERGNLASGVYLVRIRYETTQVTTRVTLIR